MTDLDLGDLNILLLTLLMPQKNKSNKIYCLHNKIVQMGVPSYNTDITYYAKCALKGSTKLVIISHHTADPLSTSMLTFTVLLLEQFCSCYCMAYIVRRSNVPLKFISSLTSVSVLFILHFNPCFHHVSNSNSVEECPMASLTLIMYCTTGL